MDFGKMDYSKSARFFPNECYVCKSRYALELCKCKMISYCSEKHRLQHSSIHEHFCKAILELLKEKKKWHIYDELIPLYYTEWSEKKNQIYKQLEAKLGRPLSSLEDSMFNRPRICFKCHEFNEYLKNCPRCPIATFCEDHEDFEIHKDTCAVMRNYIELLNITDESNIDLQFLPHCFPFVNEDRRKDYWDPLTYTMKMDDPGEYSLNSLLTKINLCNFISDASKFRRALEIIAITVPSEIIIHIKAFHSMQAIMKENYWEFLLHWKPNIKLLKIVIIGIENLKHAETSLCKNCRSMEKTLLVEIVSKSYEQYMLNEDYKVPNFLFYYKNDNVITEEIKTWSQYDFPIVMKVDSKEMFNATEYILEDVTTHQIIHKGRIASRFDGLSISKSDAYYFILKSKGNSSIEDNDNKTMENMGNISVENETNPKETNTQINFNTTEMEGELTTKRKPDTDVESVSSSSSFIILETVKSDCNTEENANEDIKPNENKIVLESTGDNSNVNNEKADKNVAQNLKDEAKKNEDQIITFDLKNLENEEKLNLFQLFLTKHISFLENENKRQQDEIERLKVQLSSSVEVVTKLQSKILQLQEMCSNLVKRNKLIKDALHGNDLEINSVIEEKVFKI